MSRLYYQKDALTRSLQANSGDGTKEYLEKVAKLVPSEIIAGYLTLIGFVPAITLIPPDGLVYVYFAVFLFCLVLTIWYMNYQAEEGKSKMTHIVVSTVAFIVWAYTISGSLVVPTAHDPVIASMVLVVFSLVSGKIPLE